MEEKKVYGSFSCDNIIFKIMIAFSAISLLLTFYFLINDRSDSKKALPFAFAAFIIFVLADIVLYFIVNHSSLSISKEKVVGSILWKTVDLPISQISSVSKGLLNTVSVATSSGKIRFFMLYNIEEIYIELSNKIAVNAKNTSMVVKQETSNADELKKYKDLLDSGVITQEEFDQKKKQLLGL